MANEVIDRNKSTNRFYNCIDNINAGVSRNKKKIALGALAVLALTGLGLAFGLHATRPAMLHFFGKMVPNAYLHGKIAPLVTAVVGGILLGALGARVCMKSRRANTEALQSMPQQGLFRRHRRTDSRPMEDEQQGLEEVPTDDSSDSQSLNAENLVRLFADADEILNGENQSNGGQQAQDTASAVNEA